ncbi:uncharacterized protein [Atheta coriaria]|uniref:uncharacterized protein n=1 Tax=Dalotia coriaria TaxID=877792 RepID=UPI0031F3B44C
MFKHTLILSAVIACALAWTIPEKFQPLADEVMEKCSKETNTPVELIKKVRAATELPAKGSDDEAKYKPYIHCGFVHTGVFKNGVFDDAVADKLIEGLQEIYNKPLRACKNERADNDVDSVWKMMHCFLEHVEDKKHFFIY